MSQQFALANNQRLTVQREEEAWRRCWQCTRQRGLDEPEVYIIDECENCEEDILFMAKSADRTTIGTDQESYSVNYEINVDDMESYLRHQYATQQSTRFNIQVVGIVISLLIGMGFLCLIFMSELVYINLSDSFRWKMFIAAIIFGCISYYPLRPSKQIRKNANRMRVYEAYPQGEQLMTLTEQHFIVSANDFEHKSKWSRVKSLVETDDAVVLVISPFSSFVVPKRYFKTPKDQQDFVYFSQTQIDEQRIEADNLATIKRSILPT